MMDWERDAWCGGDHIPTRDRERAHIVALLDELAIEWQERPPVQLPIDRGLHALGILRARIEGGGDG
jgi:hypothetical protein